MQNRRFEILKFRTMHLENHDLARQATTEDERVYPLGKWFRKLSIDEIPQFWNVLRGDMSMVGPRPHLIEHNEQFSQPDGQLSRAGVCEAGHHRARAGSRFRGEAQTSKDIENRVACDIEYLENWNLTLECGIIAAHRSRSSSLPPASAY